jgi:hypothetical protein
MSVSKMICVCLCVFLIGFTPPVRSQNQAREGALGKSDQGIPGYLDPRTGTFTTRAKSSVTGATQAGTTTILARLIFNFTILTDEPGANTVCSVSISPSDSVGFYEESASSAATNGGQACTVTLLFSWDLATPNTDMINVGYSISASGGGSQSRNSSHSLPSIPVPSNFQTITEPTISATI